MHTFAETMFWLQIVGAIINLIIAISAANLTHERSALLRLIPNVGLSVWGGLALWGA